MTLTKTWNANQVCGICSYGARIGTSDTADGEAEVAIVVVGRIDTSREVQVVSAGAIVGRRGPVVAAVASMVQSAIIDVAAIHKVIRWKLEIW